MNEMWIITTNPHRQRIWQRLFGQDRLPVRAIVPRWQHLPGRRDSTLAYDLDVTRLHAAQVERLAGYVARRAGWPYQTALAEILRGWPIEAAGCRPDHEEAETAVSGDTAVLIRKFASQRGVGTWSVPLVNPASGRAGVPTATIPAPVALPRPPRIPLYPRQ